MTGVTRNLAVQQGDLLFGAFFEFGRAHLNTFRGSQPETSMAREPAGIPAAACWPASMRDRGLCRAGMRKVPCAWG